MAKETVDSFDELPKDITRVGAHRGPARRGGGLIKLGIMLLSFGAIFFAGQYAINQWGLSLLPEINDAQVQYPEVEKPEYVPEVVAAVHDSDVSVTVLNGTETAGFASRVGDFLEGRDYNVIARANASSHEVEETVVYFNHLSAEAGAKAVAETLGVERVELATSYQGSEITIVIGADFQLPQA